MMVKVFTVDEANRILPIVQETLKSLRGTARDIVRGQDRLAVLRLIGAEDDASPERREMDELRTGLEELLSNYNARLEELQRLGCMVKDLNHGLVDFYGRRKDRLVFLCWKLGEKKIAYWHELDAGFPGRRPIQELDEGDED